MKTTLRIAFAVLLLLIALAGLFPWTTLNLISGDYTVGLSGDFLSHLAAIGGASVVGAEWFLTSALRTRS
jgi:hypothetical protein